MVDKITSPITPLELIDKTNEIIDNLGGGGGTSDYTALSNKPQINGVELSGNKTSAELGVKDDFSFNAPLVQTSVTVQNYGGIIYSDNQVTIPYNSNRFNVFSRGTNTLDCYDLNYVNGEIDWSNARYVDVPIIDNGLIGVPQNGSGTGWKGNGGAFLGKYDTNGKFVPKYAIQCNLGSNKGNYYLVDLLNATLSNSTYYARFTDVTVTSLKSTSTSSNASQGNFYNCLYTLISNNTLSFRCGVSKVSGSSVGSSYNSYFTSLETTSVSTDDVDTIRFFIRPYSTSTQTTGMGWWRYGTYTANDFSNSTTVAQAIQNLPALQFTQTTSRFANLNYGAGLTVDNNNLIVDGTTLNATSMQYLSALSLPAAGATQLTVTASPMTYTAADNGFIQIVANSTSQHYTYLNAGYTAKQSWSSAGGGYVQDYIPCLYGQTVNIAYSAATADVSLYFVPTWGGSQT